MHSCTSINHLIPLHCSKSGVDIPDSGVNSDAAALAAALAAPSALDCCCIIAIRGLVQPSSKIRWTSQYLRKKK